MDTNEAFSIDNDPAAMDFDSPEFQKALSVFDEKENEATEAEATDKQDESSAASGAKVEAEDKEPTGVLAADGKHLLPFSVVKGAREEAARWKAAADEATAQIETLKAQLTQKPGDTVDVDVDGDKTDALNAKLKQLAEDFPEFGEVASALTERVNALQAEVNTFKDDRQIQQQDVARQRETTVREAIDSNPHLSLWETEQPEAFERAVEFDKMLRERDEWKGKPIQERFDKVAALVRADYPQAKTPTSAKPQTQETKAELESRVDAALKEAGSYVPQSLSHIPGGTAPTTNDGRFDNVYDLEAFFEKATPEQAEAYLAKFG
jgi:hypothetical protein